MENNRIDYHFQESLVTRQNRAEREMLDKFHAGDYTMEHPLICVNPYFISPLSAVILFRTEKKTAVTLTVKGKEAEGDITHTFAPPQSTSCPFWVCTPITTTPLSCAPIRARPSATPSTPSR